MGPEVHLPLPGPLVEGRFVERPNRFLLRVELPASAGGGVADTHLADPGRLRELLVPGRRVWVRHAASPTRKTDWSAVQVETPDGGGLISVDTTLPNRLIRVALEAEALEELDGWTLERAEFALGRSRIDFLLSADGDRRLALEVKSVTLVDDAGLRWEAAILFVLQRSDAHRIHAARSIDPAFADALAEAKAAGVRVLGRRCRVTPERLELGDPVAAS